MLPVPTESARSKYLKGLANGQLLYQFDRVAGVPVFFPREVGPSGHPDALEWRRSSGLGVVYSITVVHPKSRPRYSIAIVELDEGFRLMSTVIDDRCDVPIGSRVRASFEPMDEESRVVFEVLR
ncbi:hypothetical protein OI25_3009 [Paraburkholderia fungorum]|uniref:ChsH2 C-terminal OB-fold domain-containing protein n=1 Tax=Paraburkholderia fungorum TaxID=134537 RepID=A0AAU8T9L3_9BURK|nr:OB-fold domain-containing protein [Paraburkholderia fungorum]AJZ60609.1 hypothetical protein OI25_3009 [Paraburkholderia fungorum]